MAVIECERCGEANREGSVVCVVCGNSLRGIEPVGTPDSQKVYPNFEESEKKRIYENTHCAICGSEEIEDGYETKLCRECRTRLTSLRVPLFIKIAAVLVAALMLFSFYRFPSVIHNGSVYYEAIDCYKAKDYDKAMKDFSELRSSYPGSYEVTGWIGLVYFVEDDMINASLEFDKLPEKANISSALDSEMEKAYAVLINGKGVESK